MSEQGVQKGTEHTPLRVPSVEDQRGGVVTYLYHLGAARQEVQDLVVEEKGLVPGSLA